MLGYGFPLDIKFGRRNRRDWNRSLAQLIGVKHPKWFCALTQTVTLLIGGHLLLMFEVEATRDNNRHKSLSPCWSDRKLNHTFQHTGVANFCSFQREIVRRRNLSRSRAQSLGEGP